MSPTAVENLRQDLSAKIRQKRKHAQYEDVTNLLNAKEEIEQQWQTAALKELVHNPSDLKKDRSAGAFFNVDQSFSDATAKVVHYGGAKLFITAVGDALAGPNFFTASGLSGDRRAIDDLSDAIQHYSSGKTRSDAQFINELAAKHKKTQSVVIAKGKAVQPVLDETTIMENKSKRMNEVLSRQAGWNGKSDSPLGFNVQIDRVDAKEHTYQIRWTTPTQVHKSKIVVVNEDGTLSLETNKSVKYTAPADLFFSLRIRN